MRRLLLILLLGSGVVALWHGPPEVCQEAVAEAGKVDLCGPMGLTDVRVALFAAVAGLLLLGEVSELQIAGVFTLKARVAEVQAAVADTRREVTELRHLTVASAQAGANASSNTTFIVDARPAATGEVLDRAQRGELTVIDAGAGASADPVPIEPPGADAAAAFGVGFAGLRSLLPAWAGGAGVVGYTLTAEGTYAPHALSRAGHDEADEVARLLMEQLGASLLDLDPRRWLAAVSVRDGTGARMGALAVLVPDPGLPPGPGGLAGSLAEQEELEAAVALMGCVYARLLIDLLGERAPSAGQQAPGGAP